MINVFFRLSEAELGTLAASGIHSIQREWNGFNIDVWSHCRSGINEVWSQTWGFGRLHACVCTSVRRLRKCVLHRQFLILFRIENLPHGGFPSTCLIIFIHHVHSFIYLYFSSFPLFFLLLFFLCSTSLLHTHICTGNDGVIFSSADRKSDEEDQGAVQHLRVVNSNPVSQTHTEMRTHTHKYRLILTLWQLIPLRQSTKLKFSSAYKCVLPLTVATISCILNSANTKCQRALKAWIMHTGRSFLCNYHEWRIEISSSSKAHQWINESVSWASKLICLICEWINSGTELHKWFIEKVWFKRT